MNDLIIKPLYSWYLINLNSYYKNKYLIATSKASKFLFIGTKFDCDIRLKQNEYDVEIIDEVDDQHALLFYDNLENQIQIKDLASLNGTYVNDIKLIENNFKCLKSNDCIKIGNFLFEIIGYEMDSYDQLMINENMTSNGNQIVIDYNLLSSETNEQEIYLGKQKFNNNKIKSESKEDILSETGTYTIERESAEGAFNTNDELRLRQEAIETSFGINEDSISMEKARNLINESSSNGHNNDRKSSSGSSITSSTNSSSTNSSTTRLPRRIRKTQTYDIINDLNSYVVDGDDLNDETLIDISGKTSLCTDLLLGDTDTLMNKLNEKKANLKLKLNQLNADCSNSIDTFSTRANVNGNDMIESSSSTYEIEHLNHHTSGLAFNINLDQQKSSPLTPRKFALRKPQKLINADCCELETARSEKSCTSLPSQVSPKSILTEQSLGTKIQKKASQNAAAAVESHSNYNLSSNRTLMLRQQSSKAKRDALTLTTKSYTITQSTSSSKPAQFAVPSTSTQSIVKAKPRNASVSSIRTNSTTTRTHSRPSSPCLGSNTHSQTSARDALTRRKNYDPIKALENERVKQRLQFTKSAPITSKQQHQTTLSNNLDFPSTSSIAESNSIVASSCDLSAPIEKLKHDIHSNTKKFMSSNLNKDNNKTTRYQPNTRLISNSARKPSNADINSKRAILTKNKNSTNQITSSQSKVQKSVTRSNTLGQFNGLTKQNSLNFRSSKENTNVNLHELFSSTLLLNNTNNTRTVQEDENTYENLLKSTVQRLCLRLIQTSTSVIDRIGDNSASILNGNNDESLKFGSTELERMQKLAKLVHSMQLINEHMQNIEKTFTNTKINDSLLLNN